MRLRAGVRLIHDRLTGRHLLVGPERGLLLDPTATAIARLIDGTRDLDALVDALQAAAPRDVVRRDVAAFLDALRARRLLDR